jgi:hypothetical protein
MESIRSTSVIAALVTTFAMVCVFFAAPSGATGAGEESAPRTARLATGLLLDMSAGSVVLPGEVLFDSQYLVLVTATVEREGRVLFDGVGGGELLALNGPPLEEAGSIHVCALEDGVTWVTAEGGCQDLQTGLVWSTSNMGGGNYGWTWSDADQFVADSTEGGYDDWRLPTKAELETVAANGAATHFSVTCAGHRWSSTRQGQRAWIVNPCDADSRLVWAGGPAESYIRFIGVREGATPDPCNNNGVCEPGEDCENCPDCAGQTNGNPANRYCCGNGVAEGPEGDGTICDGNY